MPVRIQRRRTKGWRMPEGAVYVGRPTKWGNPFRIGDMREAMNWHTGVWESWPIRNNAEAVTAFRQHTPEGCTFVADVRRELRGRDLVCWCPLDHPCHADVLLEIANASGPICEEYATQ